MRPNSRTLAAAVLALAALTGTAHAQQPRWVYLQPPVYYPYRPVYLVQRPQEVRYATPQVAPVAQGMTPAANAYTEAGAFLQALNLWRASRGARPVGWSSTLAAYAATNSWKGHQPGSSGGGSQCWAGTGSLLQALELWKGSPPHAAILLSGTVVGASPCPSGVTANVQ